MAQLSALISAILLSVRAVYTYAPQWDPNLPAECIPRHEQFGTQGEVCCPLPGFWPTSGFQNDGRYEKMSQCMQLLGGDIPRGPGPRGYRGDRECLDECLFNLDGLLTSDLKLFGEEIRKKMFQVHGGDPAWSPILDLAFDYCIQIAPADVQASSQCRSGAMQFKKCFMRQLFLNCPSSFWNNSESCTAEKALLEKCPNLKPRRPRFG